MSGAAAIPGNAGRADYPRMIYHPDGRTRIVTTPEEENSLLPDGWRQTPAPIHTSRRATPSLVAGAADPLAQLIRSVLETVLDERGIGKPQAAHTPEVPLPSRSHHRRE